MGAQKAAQEGQSQIFRLPTHSCSLNVICNCISEEVHTTGCRYTSVREHHSALRALLQLSVDVSGEQKETEMGCIALLKLNFKMEVRNQLSSPVFNHSNYQT